LYRMDYRDFVRKHKESNAAITIAALPCAEKEASAFGLMKIDGEGVVTEFAEKPKGDVLKGMQVRLRRPAEAETRCAIVILVPFSCGLYCRLSENLAGYLMGSRSTELYWL